MPNTPNLNGFRRTSPKSESETTRTRDSYENEKLKERIKMLENDQKQQNKENQILNLENKRLREENKRILDKHKVSFAQPTLDYAHPPTLTQISENRYDFGYRFECFSEFFNLNGSESNFTG